MLDVERIRHLAESYSAQEFFAAMVWQRRFNEFDGSEVLTDLVKHSDLWKSFLFSKPIYAPDKNGLSFNGVLETLLAMANYRPMPKESMIHFVRYPADTLYIIAENRDTVVAQLMDLGKKWHADEVGVMDSKGTGEDDLWEFRDYAMLRLKQGLHWNEKGDRDAVLITYWWD